MGPGHVTAACLAPFRHSSVCVFHTTQTFLLSQPRNGGSLSLPRRRSGLLLISSRPARNFSEGCSGIPAAAAGRAFLSFRIRAAFRHRRGDCLKAQKPKSPGQRGGVEGRTRCAAVVASTSAGPCKDLTSSGTTSAMAGFGRKGSGKPAYYYRFLGKSRLQRQRSRSRSRSRPAANRGKASSCRRTTAGTAHTAALTGHATASELSSCPSLLRSSCSVLRRNDNVPFFVGPRSIFSRFYRRSHR